MKWIIYDKITVHEARLSSTRILIPSFLFMQDVGFYPFLGSRACCTKPGCNRRDEIYWICCLFGGTKLEQCGSGHKILKTTLHEWLLIADRDRKNFVCQAFSPTFTDMGTNLPDSALASKRCSVTCGALSTFECQMLVENPIGIVYFHILSLSNQVPRDSNLRKMLPLLLLTNHQQQVLPISNPFAWATTPHQGQLPPLRLHWAFGSWAAATLPPNCARIWQ